MKFFRIPSAVTIALATLLTACGGSYPQTDAPAQTAALVQRVDVAANQPAQAQAQAQHPAPDCAPEGCKGLRIIDGNAEAYRIDAMRRKAAAQNDPLPQS